MNIFSSDKNEHSISYNNIGSIIRILMEQKKKLQSLTYVEVDMECYLSVNFILTVMNQKANMIKFTVQ